MGPVRFSVAQSISTVAARLYKDVDALLGDTLRIQDLASMTLHCATCDVKDAAFVVPGTDLSTASSKTQRRATR